MTEWEKFLERKKANIGFITRGKAFREPTDAEIARAIMIEVKSWQQSRGKKTFTKSEEYKVPRKSIESESDAYRRAEAIIAYCDTPIDAEGILKAQGIDVEPYQWKEIGLFKALWYWITGKKVRRKQENI